MWHFLTKNNEHFYRKQRKLPRGLSVKAGMGNRRTEWGMGEMMGMPGIRVGMREIGVRNEGNQGENLGIGVEVMNQNCGVG